MSPPAVPPASASARRAWQLPAQPLVNRIQNRALMREVAISRLVPPELASRYHRAVHDGYVTVDTVKLLCQQILDIDPRQLYPAEQLHQASTSSKATRYARPTRPHPKTRLRLSDYQRVYDAMAAEAIDGLWRGSLPALIGSLQLPATYGGVLLVLRKRGWVQMVQRGNGAPSRPSMVRLLQRPDVERWPCANPQCAARIPSVTPEGFLTDMRRSYCSTSCDVAARTGALGRKLDRLRREVGLPPTSCDRLNSEEITAVLDLIGQLRRIG